jgi:hypothetical protein
MLSRARPILFFGSKYFKETIVPKFLGRSITRFDEVVIVVLAQGILAQRVQREVCIVSVKFL